MICFSCFSNLGEQHLINAGYDDSYVICFAFVHFGLWKMTKVAFDVQCLQCNNVLWQMKFVFTLIWDYKRISGTKVGEDEINEILYLNSRYL